MSTYETEEETVEAIKKWWKENGVSVILGVTVGLGAVFGWRAWVNYQDTVGQQASAAFEQLMANAEADDADSVRRQSELIAEEFSSTPYVALSALLRARVEVEAEDTEAARAALEQAIAQAPDPAIARVAALRLARILLGEGNPDAASALIEQHDDHGSFGSDFDALRGDIAAANGHIDEAREAYQRAIDLDPAGAGLLQLKLDNLPPSG